MKKILIMDTRFIEYIQNMINRLEGLELDEIDFISLNEIINKQYLTVENIAFAYMTSLHFVNNCFDEIITMESTYILKTIDKYFSIIVNRDEEYIHLTIV